MKSPLPSPILVQLPDIWLSLLLGVLPYGPARHIRHMIAGEASWSPQEGAGSHGLLQTPGPGPNAEQP